MDPTSQAVQTVAVTRVVFSQDIKNGDGAAIQKPFRFLRLPHTSRLQQVFWPISMEMVCRMRIGDAYRSSVAWMTLEVLRIPNGPTRIVGALGGIGQWEKHRVRLAGREFLLNKLAISRTLLQRAATTPRSGSWLKQVSFFLRQILSMIFFVILFLLMFCGALWLMIALDPGYFSAWFLWDTQSFKCHLGKLASSKPFVQFL
jgi:hypothetical protein